MENSSTYTSGSGNRMITEVTGVRVASMTITTAANENGLADTPFWVRGEIVSRSDVGGYDTIQLSTEYGALYMSAVSVNIPEIDEGAEITVYFVYSGFSDALDGPCGVYAYHE